jgi:hypothetical protein
MGKTFTGYDVEFSLDGKNWHKLEGVVMDIPALNWDLARPVRPVPIWRNAGVPYAVRQGYQYGSVDHQRSIRCGFRKHGNQLRIVAKNTHLNRMGHAPYDSNNEYVISQFYID